MSKISHATLCVIAPKFMSAVFSETENGQYLCAYHDEELKEFANMDLAQATHACKLRGWDVHVSHTEYEMAIPFVLHVTGTEATTTRWRFPQGPKQGHSDRS